MRIPRYVDAWIARPGVSSVSPTASGRARSGSGESADREVAAGPCPRLSSPEPVICLFCEQDVDVCGCVDRSRHPSTLHIEPTYSPYVEACRILLEGR